MQENFINGNPSLKFEKNRQSSVKNILSLPNNNHKNHNSKGKRRIDEEDTLKTVPNKTIINLAFHLQIIKSENGIPK